MFNKLFLSTFIAVTVVITGFAQIAPQPVFTIDCPTETVIGRDLVSLTAYSDDEIRDEPAYDWSLSSGTITSGQGTKSIEIDTRAAESITATLEINGDAFETITSSCTFEVLRKPRPRLTFEFDYSTRGHVKLILDAFFIELTNEPDATGYIFIYPSTDKSFKEIDKLIRDQVGFQLYDLSRLVFVRGEKRTPSHLQFWLVPPGADAPVPESKESEEQTDKPCSPSKKPGSPECPKGETSKLRILKKPSVFYTFAASEANIRGSVRLKVIFQANGEIGKIEVIKALGYGLTEVAISAARRITFKPAMRNGVPVATAKQVVFRFDTY